MVEKDLQQQLEVLQKKLNTARRQNAVFKEKARLLEMNYEDSRSREDRTSELVMELIERQKELNLMLYRANAIIGRAQEAMALSSSEFSEMAKALPEPKQAEWSDRVSRINDLFKKTGVQDADIKEDAFFSRPDVSEISKDSKVAFGEETGKIKEEIKAVPTDESTEEEFRKIADMLKQEKFCDAEIVEEKSETAPEPVESATEVEEKKPWWKNILRRDN